MEFTDILDESMGIFMARMDLVGRKCHLNHSYEEEAPDAVDYLCQYIGKLDDPEVEPTLLRIPVCAECASALFDEDWLLFYCLTCNSSQWLLKSRAKKLYPKWESVRFLNACPNCSECPTHKE